jgi:hypothetical protein
LVAFWRGDWAEFGESRGHYFLPGFANLSLAMMARKCTEVGTCSYYERVWNRNGNRISWFRLPLKTKLVLTWIYEHVLSKKNKIFGILEGKKGIWRNLAKITNTACFLPGFMNLSLTQIYGNMAAFW